MDNNVNEIGRKTYFWYRVYCGLLIVVYLAVAVIGVSLLVIRLDLPDNEREQLLIIGIINLVISVPVFIISVVAIFLPPKPYNWTVGFMLMAISMTSCCFWPFVIPLIIYWVKPETQAFFGRKQLT